MHAFCGILTQFLICSRSWGIEITPEPAVLKADSQYTLGIALKTLLWYLIGVFLALQKMMLQGVIEGRVCMSLNLLSLSPYGASDTPSYCLSIKSVYFGSTVRNSFCISLFFMFECFDVRRSRILCASHLKLPLPP